MTTDTSNQGSSHFSQERRARRSFSLRAKLVTAFLAVTIIPLAIISLITYTSSRAALINDANQKLTAAASQVALGVDTFIGLNLENVRAAGKFPVVVEYLLLPADRRAGSPEEKRLYKLLPAIASQDPVFISSVAVFDLKGMTVADTFAADIGVDKASRLYFRETLASGLPYISDVEFSATSGVPSIYFAAPVRDAAGKMIGVIRTRYAASILQKLIVAQTGLAGKSSYAVLLDSHHIRLAHGFDRARIFKSIVPLEAALVNELQTKGLLPAGAPQELATNLIDFETGLQNLAQSPYFAADTNGDGGLEQTAVVTLTTRPWIVAYIQSQAVFLAPVTAQITSNLLAAVIIALVVGGAGFFFSQTLSGPVVRLTRTAEAIAAGDINAQARVETGDEIGALAQTFNRMTAQLRDFIGALERRGADLATVAEVGTATATILETDRLLQTVVDLTKERFNLYHSHIYLLDEAGENLVLAAGAGEPGRRMKVKGLSIPLRREQSLVAHAAREQKGVTVNDVTQAPDFLPNPLLPDTRSELAVPMIVGGKVIGVFDVQSDRVGRFTDSDINIQTTLAAQVATFIQNVRQFENTQKLAADMGVVANVGIATSTISDVEEMLKSAVHLTQRGFGLYHAHIFTYNENTAELEIAACGWKEGDPNEGLLHGNSPNISLNQEQSLVARAARTREGVVVNDVTAAPDFLPNPLLPDTRSEMAVPMIVAGKVIGVLDVQSETANRFTEVDVNIQATLAAQIAIALQNARSFSQTQRQAERETAVNLITQKIQNATSIERALQVAVRELGHRLGRPTRAQLQSSENGN